MSNSIVDSLNFLMKSQDFIELNRPGFKIDLRYGSTNNFVGVNMYGPFNKAFLHKVAAEKLFAAHAKLIARHPRYSFIIYDALRPRSIQRVLWSHVEGTPGEKYIARPEPGSLHNFGFAVDLSILDEHGRELLDRLVQPVGVLGDGGLGVHGIHYIHKTVNGAIMAV